MFRQGTSKRNPNHIVSEPQTPILLTDSKCRTGALRSVGPEGQASQETERYREEADLKSSPPFRWGQVSGKPGFRF